MERKAPPPSRDEGDAPDAGWLPPRPPSGAQQPGPPSIPAEPDPPVPPPRLPFQQAPPPGAYPPPAYPPQPWQPLPPSPGNGEAVAGFVCAVTGLTLLVFSVGMSTIISLVLGIVALPYARRGTRNVDEGRTRKHADLARAGRVIGIVTIVLAVLATLFWGTMLALAIGGAFDGGSDQRPGGDFVLSTVARATGAAARLLA